MYQPHFSRAAIQRLEPDIHEKVAKFLRIVKGAAQDSKVVDLSMGFKCLAADIVMGYCYQKVFGALDASGVYFQLLLDLEELTRGAPLACYYPELMNGLARILDAAPKALVEFTLKPMAATFEIQKACGERISALRAEDRDSITSTVFQTALNPDEKKGTLAPSLEELSADALLYFVADTSGTVPLQLSLLNSINEQTRVSQTAYAYHMSKQYFTDAPSFRPGRWLREDSHELEKQLLSFSKGSRACLGINKLTSTTLAYAELYTVFAYVFHKFDLQVHNTTDWDMEWKDCYVPATYGHLKVTASERRDFTNVA